MYRTVYTSTSTAPAPVALKPAVLVIGGGLVGLTVACELAREGIHVDIVEKGAVRNPFRRRSIMTNREVLYAA